MCNDERLIASRILKGKVTRGARATPSRRGRCERDKERENEERNEREDGEKEINTLYYYLGNRPFSSSPYRPNSAFHQGVPLLAEVEVLWLP